MKVWMRWRQCKWCGNMYERKTVKDRLAYCSDACHHAARNRQTRLYMRRRRRIDRDATSVGGFANLKTINVDGQPRVKAAVELERSRKKC